MSNTLKEQQFGVDGEYVNLDGKSFFKISNHHLMDDFFMSITGPSDHWMFVSSHGALTAGRRNSDFALFPYGSDDQISANRGLTGPVTMIKSRHVQYSSESAPIWEPFANENPGTTPLRSNIYKNPLGNKVVFEQVNEDLELAFRYRWTFSEKFGFVRSCELTNLSDEPRELEILDGFKNVLPYGVGREFLMRFSNLGNAYKKNELLEASKIGIFYLSSIPTDRAEPSEGLLATTVWQHGLNATTTMLSTDQVDRFCQDKELFDEYDIRGKAGAFLQTAQIELAAGESKSWITVADLSQGRSDIVELEKWLLSDADIIEDVESDISRCENELLKIVASSDGVQKTANERRVNRHLSNSVFNLMRGGIPLCNYDFPTKDFVEVVRKANHKVYQENESFLNSLPESMNVLLLKACVSEQANLHLTRIANEYLPLTFGRRHGDPTRPWNHFSIDIKNEEGETNLSYQGNWRDIFQNWEAVGVSFPYLLPAMVCRFVNATTADGYNPYRVTKEGLEWEEPSPDDPWSNIGYWGDHQIIYLLKLLEWTNAYHPDQLKQMLIRHEFVHANVPYRITTYENIRKDPQSTIDFDFELAKEISEGVETEGFDAKLLKDESGETVYVSLMEKLLTLTLAKLSNFVPDGGIWLNTQRPEWNDANNALVGNGLSMVTTCYLYRCLKFLRELVSGNETDFGISNSLFKHWQEIKATLKTFAPYLETGHTGESRNEMVSALSISGSDYRTNLYKKGLDSDCSVIAAAELCEFIDDALSHLDQTIRGNKRPDGLFHTYNLIETSDSSVDIRYLYEMLEGQVAVLSSGILSAQEVVELLDALRESRLYRADQQSYLLYPDRSLPRFMEKNQVENDDVNASELLQQLLSEGNRQIVDCDANGVFHFNGKFRNSSDLREALQLLEPKYDELVKQDGDRVCQLFEQVFNHAEFTGRSGTFFAYEGLGSIYWHMVSKLGLAVSENLFWAIDKNESEEVLDVLRSHFNQIHFGIGAEKNPDEYGAFPTDPYSHTPENAGVKQPGMTGQVKEDVLSRLAEVGVGIDEGCLRFRFDLFDLDELIGESKMFGYVDVDGRAGEIEMERGTAAFTFCQVPVIVKKGNANRIQLKTQEGDMIELDGLRLSREQSQKVFARTGWIKKIVCEFIR